MRAEGPWVTLEGRAVPTVATPEDGGGRMIRGGAWDSTPRYLRLADRNWMNAAFRFDNQGFRLVRSLG